MIRNNLFTRIQIDTYSKRSVVHHVNKKANHTKTDDYPSRTFVFIICWSDLLVKFGVHSAVIGGNAARSVINVIYYCVLTLSHYEYLWRVSYVEDRRSVTISSNYICAQIAVDLVVPLTQVLLLLYTM